MIKDTKTSGGNTCDVFLKQSKAAVTMLPQASDVYKTLRRLFAGDKRLERAHLSCKAAFSEYSLRVYRTRRRTKISKTALFGDLKLAAAGIVRILLLS